MFTLTAHISCPTLPCSTHAYTRTNERTHPLLSLNSLIACAGVFIFYFISAQSLFSNNSVRPPPRQTSSPFCGDRMPGGAAVPPTDLGGADGGAADAAAILDLEKPQKPIPDGEEIWIILILKKKNKRDQKEKEKPLGAGGFL